MERRKFVKMAGMASVAATTGMAGCQGDGNGTEDGSPTGNGTLSGGGAARYNPWVLADAADGSEAFAISIDWQANTAMGDGEQTATEDPELQNDVLAVTPMSWLVFAAFAVGFGLSQLGLGDATKEEGPTEYVHIASGGTIFEGSYDTDSYGDSVEQAGASEVEDYNGYTLYEMSGTQNAVIGLSSETLVVVQASSDGVSDPMARAKALIDADAGNAALLSDEAEPFDDIVNALPNRDVMGGVYSSEAEPLNKSTGDSEGGQTGFAQTDLDGEVNALATSADISQDGMTSAIALRYASESEVNAKADIEAAIGGMASNQSVTIDGTLVVIEGEYDAIPSLSSN